MIIYIYKVRTRSARAYIQEYPDYIHATSPEP